jgi:hypothetical protein
LKVAGFHTWRFASAHLKSLYESKTRPQLNELRTALRAQGIESSVGTLSPNLNHRVTEAKLNGWLGEVASLHAAARKLVSLDRMRDRQPAGLVNLGIPIITGR